jgi:iron(III) transport system permease protein
MAATTVARRTAIRLPSWRAEVVVLVAAAALLAYLTVVPLAMLVLGALSATGSALDFQLTTRYLERVLTDQASVELLLNSLIYAGGAAALAFVLGTAVAWAVERTDVPARSLWYGIALVPRSRKPRQRVGPTRGRPSAA